MPKDCDNPLLDAFSIKKTVELVLDAFDVALQFTGQVGLDHRLVAGRLWISRPVTLVRPRCAPLQPAGAFFLLLLRKNKTVFCLVLSSLPTLTATASAAWDGLCECFACVWRILAADTMLQQMQRVRQVIDGKRRYVSMNQLTNRVKSILMETARNLGIQVLETPFLNYYDAGIYGLYTRYKGVDVIIISSNVSQEEQTFTLAHELAHYILHREDLNDRYCRYRYWNDNRYQNRKEAS
ncbi:ImmA/IrrE family metallo-endopeptidase [Desulfallas thermosapovorans]|uniref:Uncharacterized protein DUF955 n=1 Tax=Desulfallas thermosapovorans DSM 6562 TaxID=1121431 RepID=A0A5S4ZPK1_9FIRM|nr:ImmA/IrrE family metallo-endopeptidase [Desulfallas thermosapovorans]TYO94471.1 uncharacterized protein DUF955 [Desulfallas thermosapovorans DSM 6562]